MRFEGPCTEQVEKLPGGVALVEIDQAAWIEILAPVIGAVGERLCMPRNVETGDAPIAVTEQLYHRCYGPLIDCFAGVLPGIGNFALKGDIAGVDLRRDVMYAHAERIFFHDSPKIRILTPGIGQKAGMQISA